MRGWAAAAVTRAALAAASVLASACHTKPPAPLPVVPAVPGGPGVPATASRTVIPSSQRTIFVHVTPPSMTMPAVPVPDLAEEPRWPLSITDHPKLEPHHDIAGVLAEPGISWTELCARGVHKRRDPSHRDELAYLSAWCAAEHHDVRTAVTTLAPLLHSVVPEIANAVPFDLANILVDSQDAEHAEQLLSDEGLRDPHLWDVLAASYFEVGKDADALHATSTAIQLAPAEIPATTCHRLTREILLGSDALREVVRKDLDRLSMGNAPDPTCVDLAATVACSASRRTCDRYYLVKQVDPERVKLWQIYETWSEPRDYSAWIDMAWRAEAYFATDPVALDMTLQAFDAALVASNCEEKALNDIWRAVYAMQTGSNVAGFRERSDLAWAFVQTPKHCAAFRERWLAAHPQ